MCRDENAPEMITDAAATMPDGWLVDEPEHVADETSEKPADWDEDMDGKWEPAKISELTCCGVSSW